MPANWRIHPKLGGRFHPDFPDDLQVIVHEGGPRLAKARPELIWVRVTDGEDDLFTGTILNQPVGLTSVAAGSSIRFLVPKGGDYPLMVTEKYLRERPHWNIRACDKCGLTELLDAPSDLVRAVFSPLRPREVTVSFTALCLCGGILVVGAAGFDEEEEASPGPEVPHQQTGWWKTWRSRLAALLARRRH
jgi:hypothetical protein